MVRFYERKSRYRGIRRMGNVVLPRRWTSKIIQTCLILDKYINSIQDYTPYLPTINHISLFVSIANFVWRGTHDIHRPNSATQKPGASDNSNQSPSNKSRNSSPTAPVHHTWSISRGSWFDMPMQRDLVRQLHTPCPPR